jgi:hypothetical protein
LFSELFEKGGGSMDCEEVRDRFSSLWEKDLSSLEEKIFKEHLSSCPKCQKEFEQFGKTMRWLQSIGEAEVPEGFFPELYRKIEEKKRATPGEKSRGRRLHFPLSFRLPAQAVAMVAIVFLVLYLTKIMPMEGNRLKETKQTAAPLSVQEKPGPVLAQKGVDGERRAWEIPTETPRPEDVAKEKVVPEEGKLEGAPVPQVKAEVKKKEAPARSTEVLGYQTLDSKGAARVSVPSPEPGKIERELAVHERSLVASKPPQEIILRVSDRKEAVSRLRELVKQFEGEVVTQEGDRLLASLPTGSFSEFEKELAGLRSSGKTDPLLAKKHATGSLRYEEGTKREEVDQKTKERATFAADTERRTIVRILLVQE